MTNAIIRTSTSRDAAAGDAERDGEQADERRRAGPSSAGTCSTCSRRAWGPGKGRRAGRRTSLYRAVTFERLRRRRAGSSSNSMLGGISLAPMADANRSSERTSSARRLGGIAATTSATIDCGRRGAVRTTCSPSASASARRAGDPSTTELRATRRRAHELCDDRGDRALVVMVRARARRADECGFLRQRVEHEQLRRGQTVRGSRHRGRRA